MSEPNQNTQARRRRPASQNDTPDRVVNAAAANTAASAPVRPSQTASYTPYPQQPPVQRQMTNGNITYQQTGNYRQQTGPYTGTGNYRQQTGGYTNTNGYIPLNQTTGQVTRSHTVKERKLNDKKPPYLLILLAVLVVVAGSALAVNASRNAKAVKEMNDTVAAYNGYFCEGVYVDGIHLGGMTQQAGIDAVTNQAANRNASWSVNLTYQGEIVTTITADMVGMTVDVMDTLREAWQQGHTGDVAQRKAAMDNLRENHWEGYTAIPSGNASTLDAILEQLQNSFYRPATDAYLINFVPENSYPFVFQDAVPGRMLNINDLRTTLYHMVSSMESGNVELQPQMIQPNVTVDDLKVNLSMRSMASTAISTTSTQERTDNIRRCFQSITGYVLNPGDRFSFNSVVGERTLANGFFEAIEYAYGEPVMGVGGGSCQASTTLYQAAVTAGLDIISSTPHSDAVGYSNYGEDATVYWMGSHKIDLVFRNNTQHPIYIVAAVQSDPSNRKRFIARVTMYGENLGDTTYALYAETTEVLPIPETPTYIKDKNAEHVTYTDEEYVSFKGAEGCVVDSWRITYQNGEEISRYHLRTDTYKAKPVKIYVGTTKR